MSSKGATGQNRGLVRKVSIGDVAGAEQEAEMIEVDH
jgi:hypothetical protein